MARITINGISLDPIKEATQLQSRSLVSVDSQSSDYILIQSKNPLSPDQKSQLASMGVEMLEYVPENTYICRYRPTDLAPLRALPFLAWVNTYIPGFKIAPTLRSPQGARAANLLDLRGLPGTPARETRLVDVVLHRGVDPGTVASAVAQAAGVDAATLESSGGKFRLKVEAQRLPGLAALDQVRHLEPVFPNKLFNNVALSLMRADVVHQQTDMQGQGQVVAICDTGFDLGDSEDVHPAFAGRVLRVYPLGRDTGNDPHGHGTHVCGSAVGDGFSSELGTIRGSAPRAQLVVQSVLDAGGGLGGLPDDLGDLFSPPYNEHGARVHSNSWGADNNAYTQDSQNVDAFVWNNRDAVILFAAGNAGADSNRNGIVDPGSLGSPATAKNCITVGASENDRPSFEYVNGATHIGTYGEGWPDSYPVPPLADDRLADNPQGLAAFSSRGPTSDGRIKPDVVAPGTAILSTRSRADGVGNGWGPSADPAFFFEGGTSMATPLVAGCAAVVRQYLQQQQNIARPSAALVKALLINAAQDLVGQYAPSELGGLPNNAEGFGRIDLQATVNALGEDRLMQFWDEDVSLDTGERQVFQVPLPRLASKLKVTLVWTDLPGEALQNDLDLIVRTARGTVRHGNIPGASTLFDRRNNVEQVVMTTVLPGALQITVQAHRATTAAQTFALVVSAEF
jgi:serine protease AprX